LARVKFMPVSPRVSTFNVPPAGATDQPFVLAAVQSIDSW
jgi:hypothetical protein